MQITVIGGGPAGCRTSELLARAGHYVALLDAQGPWEKPCGGGLTAKAVRAGRFPADALPHGTIDRITVYYGDRKSVTLAPEEPPIVVSRRELGAQMMAAARSAGVRFIRDRAVRVAREGNRWKIETREDGLEADFIVGADGATSFVRRNLGTPLSSEDLNVTLGYFIPNATSSHMKIFFLPGMEGYIWSFPRPDHISYGLMTRPEPAWTSRCKTLLANFIEADLGPDALEQAEFYSAPVPGLRPGSWAANRITGDGWALAGDAAGLVDPITGEGIYYALRSAEMLAEAFPDPERYRMAVERELVPELARASAIYRRFYRGRFLGGSFRERMVQVARRSPTVRQILGNLIAGSQPYIGLKGRLVRSIPRVAFDMVRSRPG